MAVVGKLTFETEINTKSFDKQIRALEIELDKLTKARDKALEDRENGIHRDVDAINQMTLKIEKLNNKLVDLKKRKQDANKEPIDEDSGGFKGLSGIIKKITKIGLGLVGLRTGMALLRSSVSMVASQNDEIATKINTIKSAIANALTPVVQFVVNLFARLVAYVGYIIKAWTGKDIFKNSAKSTNKMKNNMGGVNKEASKLKRTLAGFDEMNILQKDGGVSSGGGGGGVSSNDVDMSMFKDIEIPQWVQWIGDNKEKVLGYLKEIAKWILIAFAIGTVTKFMGIIDAIKIGLGALYPALKNISGAKIFTLITGVAVTISGIVELIKVLTSENVRLEEVLNAVSDILIGIGLIIASFTPWGWVVVGIGLLGNLISSLIDTRSEEEKLEETKQNLADAQKKVNEAYQEYINANKTHLNAYKSVQNAQKKVTDTANELSISEDRLNEIGEDLFEGIRNGTYDIEKLGDEETGLTTKYGLQEDQLLKVYEAYVDLKDSKSRLTTATDNLTESEKKYTDAQKEEYLRNLNNERQIFKATGDYSKLGKAMEDAYKSGAISSEQMGFAISSILQDMDEKTRKTFVKQLPDDIKFAALSTEKTWTNALAKEYILKFGVNTSSAQQKIKQLAEDLKKLKLGKYVVNVGTNGYAKGGIVGLPKLAPGGIINRPGPGVAIGGERGTEGVVPLTDSQQMARLGEAIGRWVNIRAEIPVSVGNRQIAREIRNINAEESFAFNG